MKNRGPILVFDCCRFERNGFGGWYRRETSSPLVGEGPKKTGKWEHSTQQLRGEGEKCQRLSTPPRGEEKRVLSVLVRKERPCSPRHLLAAAARGGGRRSHAARKTVCGHTAKPAAQRQLDFTDFPRRVCTSASASWRYGLAKGIRSCSFADRQDGRLKDNLY